MRLRRCTKKEYECLTIAAYFIDKFDFPPFCNNPMNILIYWTFGLGKRGKRFIFKKNSLVFVGCFDYIYHILLNTLLS